jgi:microcystin degradation protein MlrC
MSRPLRLAYGRISQETNALSPVLTTFEDFRSVHLLKGEEIATAISSGLEVKGYLKRAELTGFVKGCAATSEVTPVPLLSAWAVPSGPLTGECLETLSKKLEASLRAAMPLDGVYLCLHGAMGARSVRDPESRMLEVVRSVVGPDVPVVATYDLHGILTAERVALTDALVAYRTNPHRDHVAVGRRAAELLASIARCEVRPTIAWRSLPMFLGGGINIDFLAPMAGIFKRMRAMEREARVLSTSLLTCHPWNDDPALGWGVAVITDGDCALAERLADELAERAWAVKDHLPPSFDSPTQAIEKARKAWIRRKFGVVTIADASDVVSAGAPGDNTRLLRALLEEAKGLRCYVPIRDPEAVEQAWSHREGETLTVSLGGALDPQRNVAIPVTAVLERKVVNEGTGATVVLRAGQVRIVVVSGPALAVQPAFYKNVGLDPWKADIVVVKNFFPFRLYFLPYTRLTIYVRTSGVTDFDAASALPFDGPMHPRDPVTDWREADRRRRAVGAELRVS